MLDIDKQKWIEDLNSVLNSKKKKLGKKNRETLICLREKIKVCNTKKKWIEILKDLAKVIGAGISIFKDD